MRLIVTLYTTGHNQTSKTTYLEKSVHLQGNCLQICCRLSFPWTAESLAFSRHLQSFQGSGFVHVLPLRLSLFLHSEGKVYKTWSRHLSAEDSKQTHRSQSRLPPPNFSRVHVSYTPTTLCHKGRGNLRHAHTVELSLRLPS